MRTATAATVRPSGPVFTLGAQPNMATLKPREKSVVLTGYDIVVNCPQCRTQQVISDDVGALHCVLGTDEYVSLHALPGRYVLNYSFRCWNCTQHFSGLLTIRSRAAQGG